MRSPDEDSNVARYACNCAANILRQSPEHRAACEAAIAPRVFALVKHATAIVLRAGVSDVPQVTAVAGSSGGGAGAAADAAAQSRVKERQPPEYLVSALNFLNEVGPSTDTNVIRTTLMLLASLRKLPQTSPVLSATEAALAFLMGYAHGPVEQRQALIDGGILNSVFDMLAHMGRGDPDAYVTACGTLYHLVQLCEGESYCVTGAPSESAPIIGRVLAAAFAHGPLNDQRVPIPLWNFANGVAGYPTEIAALVAAKRLEGGGAPLDGSAEEQARYADAIIHTMTQFMRFGLGDGSDFNNGCLDGNACGNPQSWWYALLHRLRALLKNSRNPSAAELLLFCSVAGDLTAEVLRDSKRRLRQ
jgi:hypothetical protein